MRLIRSYFPETDPQQQERFRHLLELLPRLNRQVNVISRKDIGELEERHVLHSLAIARQFPFPAGTEVIDAGTGGGLPGIPLAIMFPGARFTLVDSIGKKIRLVRELTASLGLQNVEVVQARVEEISTRADFVVSRAVAPFPVLFGWTAPLIRTGGDPELPNGLIALKGGDLSEELRQFHERVKVFPISRWFAEPFFLKKRLFI